MAKRKWNADDGNVDWTQWDSKLGTMSDAALAKLIPCSQSLVCKRRVKLGVPAVLKDKHVHWEQWDALLGTMSDTELARKIGCAPSSVKRRREFYLVPRYNKNSKNKRFTWKE